MIPNGMETQTLCIGTRGSRLALWQAEHVQARLRQYAPGVETRLQVITTSGDWKPSEGERPLKQNHGGKAQFAKEIEEALLAGTIDIGVHSMKDMDSTLPEGLSIPVFLPREEPHDALLVRNRHTPLPADSALWPKGTHLGTTSPRRAAGLLARNPDLVVTPLRGNVETRISKLRGKDADTFGRMDVTCLALAGLKRLKLIDEIDQIVPLTTLLPAAGQGTIGIEMRTDRMPQLMPLFQPLNCRRTRLRTLAERAVLARIEGSCHTPIGIYAQLTHEGIMTVKAHLFSPDGQHHHTQACAAPAHTDQEACAVGTHVGQALLSGAPKALLNAVL